MSVGFILARVANTSWRQTFETPSRISICANMCWRFWRNVLKSYTLLLPWIATSKLFECENKLQFVNEVWKIIFKIPEKYGISTDWVLFCTLFPVLAHWIKAMKLRLETWPWDRHTTQAG